MSNQSCICDTLVSVLYKKERITYTAQKSYFQSEIVTNPHDYIHKVEILYLVSFRTINRFCERFYIYSMKSIELQFLNHFTIFEFSLRVSVMC